MTDCNLTNNPVMKIKGFSKLPANLLQPEVYIENTEEISPPVHLDPSKDLDSSSDVPTPSLALAESEEHSVDGLVCDDCHDVFSTQKILNRHKEKHTGRKFKCPICNKSFSRKDALGTHRKNQH